VPVRVYVPFGVGYLPYALREIRRRPESLWWLARDAALGRRRVSDGAGLPSAPAPASDRDARFTRDRALTKTR
jgi:hypothetical protein